MITSAKGVLRFTPRLLRDKSDPVVYLIKKPTLNDVSDWHFECTARGVKYVSFDNLLAGMRSGLKELLPNNPELLADQLAFVDEYQERASELEAAKAEIAPQLEATQPELEAALEAEDNEAFMRVMAVRDEIELPISEPRERLAALRSRMDDLESQMSMEHPAYGRLLARQLRYHEKAPMIAAEMFLMGAEGSNVEIIRERGRVSDEILTALPKGHAMQIGGRAIQAMNAIGEDAKNSDGPSSSGSNPKRSGRASKARGTSTASK